MWHPFDLMSKELAVDETLRAAGAPQGCRLIYGERITRWFKDKSDAVSQWPPTVDHKPGVTIARRVEGENWDVEVSHVWKITITQSFSAKLSVRRDGWRSPIAWQYTQNFVKEHGGMLVPDTRGTGSWKDGVISTNITGASGKLALSEPAPSLCSLYSLLADFPAEPARLGEAALLGENLMYFPKASFSQPSAALAANPLAIGLKGYILRPAMGWPMDFWVNEQGLVVYWCQGPHRAFVLEKIEGLA